MNRIFHEANSNEEELDHFTVNRFRKNRGKILAAHINNIAHTLGRDLHIIDLGGRATYWNNVPECRIKTITLTNLSDHEFEDSEHSKFEMQSAIADATNLAEIADRQFDLVHSNSVIEHVGPWDAMERMARETQRVALHGWIQTPAWEFPIEPHYRAPFLHWLGTPARRRIVQALPAGKLMSLGEARNHADWINMMSRKEFAELYKGKKIHTERFMLFPKSYVCSW